MDGLVEMYIQGKLIAAGLLSRKWSPETDFHDKLKLEEETFVAPEGIALLRRLGLLGADEK